MLSKMQAKSLREKAYRHYVSQGGKSIQEEAEQNLEVAVMGDGTVYFSDHKIMETFKA